MVISGGHVSGEVANAQHALRINATYDFNSVRWYRCCRVIYPVLANPVKSDCVIDVFGRLPGRVSTIWVVSIHRVTRLAVLFRVQSWYVDCVKRATSSMLLVWLMEPLGWNILSEKNTRKIGLYAQQKHRADTDLQELLFSNNNNNNNNKQIWIASWGRNFRDIVVVVLRFLRNMHDLHSDCHLSILNCFFQFFYFTSITFVSTVYDGSGSLCFLTPSYSK